MFGVIDVSQISAEPKLLIRRDRDLRNSPFDIKDGPVVAGVRRRFLCEGGHQALHKQKKAQNGSFHRVNNADNGVAKIMLQNHLHPPPL